MFWVRGELLRLADVRRGFRGTFFVEGGDHQPAAGVQLFVFIDFVLGGFGVWNLVRGRISDSSCNLGLSPFVVAVVVIVLVFVAVVVVSMLVALFFALPVDSMVVVAEIVLGDVQRARDKGVRPFWPKIRALRSSLSRPRGPRCHGSVRRVFRHCWPSRALATSTSTLAPTQGPFSILDGLAYVSFSLALSHGSRFFDSLLVSPALLQSCSFSPACYNEPNHSGATNDAREAKYSYDDGGAFCAILALLVCFDGTKYDSGSQAMSEMLKTPMTTQNSTRYRLRTFLCDLGMLCIELGGICRL